MPSVIAQKSKQVTAENERNSNRGFNPPAISLLIKKQFTLNKQERLKSRKQIERLFGKGMSIFVFPIKVLFELTDADTGILQAGVAVSSKTFKKAVDRNRIKRLMREAYRLQKGELHNSIRDSGKHLSIFFIYTAKELPDMADIMDKIKTILGRLNAIVIHKNS